MKIYCKSCNKPTPHRQKGVRSPVNVCNKCDSTNMPVTLIREGDGLVNHGNTVKFIEWSEGRGKALHDEPVVGASCVLDLSGPLYWGWMTTEISEILEDVTKSKNRCIKFRTKNSEYTLYLTQSDKTK